MDFITPFMPQSGGPRMVDADILKGQQAMGELAQIPSKIRMQEAHAELYAVQAERQREAIRTAELTRQALNKIGAGQRGDPSAGGGNEEGYGVGLDQLFNNSAALQKHPLLAMSEALRSIDPKLSGQLYNQYSLDEARKTRALRDQERQRQIAVSTAISNYDLSAREIAAAQDADSLANAIVNAEKRGIKTGMIGPNGEPPTINLQGDGLFKMRDYLAAQFGNQRDRIMHADREASRELRERELSSVDTHRRWQRDDDAQRRSAEAKRKPIAEKAGEKPLTATERKQGKDAITTRYPNIDPPARAAALGDELMERAKRSRQKNETLTEAMNREMDKMNSEGRFSGIPGSGRSQQSPKDLPRDSGGKINKKAMEPNTWYRDGNSIWFYDGEMTYTPRELQQKEGARPMSYEPDDDLGDNLDEEEEVDAEDDD